MASFDDPLRPRRAAWPSAGGPGEYDDGFRDPVGDGRFDDSGFPDPGPDDRGFRRGPARRDRGQGPKRRNPIWRFRRLFFLVGLLTMALLAGVVAKMAQTDLPQLEDLRQTSFICPVLREGETCTSGNAMARLSSEENRENVKLEDLPDHLVEAVIAAEDRDFYDHTGIDPVGIARALYRDVRAGGLEQGGSTLTQQLVKNRYLSNERSLNRKLEEALLAIRVEQEMSKDEILEAYLNTIYLGRNAYGVQAASRAYFGMDVRELDIGQAAYLAGLIRGPELADAERDPEEAERRRRTVLDAMLDEDYINERDHEWHDAVPITAGLQPRGRFRQTTTMFPATDEKGAQYVNDYVRRQASAILEDRLGYEEEEALRLISNGGLRIYTTIDLGLQAQAYDAVYTNTLNQEGDPAGALVALNREGHVVAMVGGEAGGAEQTQFVNYATAGRPVGSTFKPIALAEAVASNHSLTGSSLQAPGTAVIPSDIPECATEWEVSNYDEEDARQGNLNLVDATKYSSNTAYGHLMAELTPERVKDMAQKLGMDSELSDCLPTVLGADNSTALEMAEVYSTFANRGVHREPTVITRIEQVDNDGEVEELYRWEPEETRPLTETQADLVNYTLQQVVQGGTGEAARLDDRQVAGKTGTTQSSRDAWFVGYTPGAQGLTASVWMGHPNAECDEHDPETGEPIIDQETGQPKKVTCPMNNEPGGRAVRGRASVTGGSFPAEIFKKFMQTAMEARPMEEFVEPPPEDMRQGERIGGGGGYDSGEQGTTTMPTGPFPGGGPQPSGPWPPSTQPGNGGRPTTTETSSTSTPDPTDTTGPSITVWPPTSNPGGGGGGGPP